MLLCSSYIFDPPPPLRCSVHKKTNWFDIKKQLVVTNPPSYVCKLSGLYVVPAGPANFFLTTPWRFSQIRLLCFSNWHGLTDVIFLMNHLGMFWSVLLFCAPLTGVIGLLCHRTCFDRFLLVCFTIDQVLAGYCTYLYRRACFDRFLFVCFTIDQLLSYCTYLYCRACSDRFLLVCFTIDQVLTG